MTDKIETGAPDEVALLLDSVRGSAARLGASLGPLTDLQAREPSALAGWSRGHLVTHLARSADVYRWLLTLARTGSEPGPRADAATLERALHEGAGRGGAELVADLRGSLDRLLDEAESMPAGCWSTLVSALAGWRHPAWFTLHRCRRELETHHADLDLSYTSADWPADYVAWALESTLTALAARSFPVARIQAPDLGRRWTLSGSGPTVTGPGHALLAWLAGRTHHPRLHADLPLRPATLAAPTGPRLELSPTAGRSPPSTAAQR